MHFCQYFDISCAAKQNGFYFEDAQRSRRIYSATLSMMQSKTKSIFFFPLPPRYTIPFRDVFVFVRALGSFVLFLNRLLKMKDFLKISSLPDIFFCLEMRKKLLLFYLFIIIYNSTAVRV